MKPFIFHSFCVLAVLCAVNHAFSASLEILNSETPAEKIRALDGAVFQVTEEGVLLETQGAQKQGKTVFPGIAVVGEWDIREFNAVEIVVEHRDTKTRLPLRVRLAGDAGNWENLGGTENAYILPAEVSKRGTETALLPIMKKKFNTTGMRRTPWDGQAVSDTLNGTKITSVGVYMTKPLLDWKWAVKKITLKKVDWKAIQEEEGTSAKPKPFQHPTAQDYYRYFDANPVWEKMTETEFFPFIDRYGQFKHKEWPGKIHTDAELQCARETEEEDLRKNPGPKDWDEFGGWEAGPKLTATGKFRTEKIDGKWWLVTPTGHLYWSHGPVRINASSAVTPLDGRKHYFAELPEESSPLAEFYHTNDAVLKGLYDVRGIQETYDFSSANAFRKYGGADWWEKYADMAHRRLRSWGMNTIANSSDVRIALQNRTPFCDRLSMEKAPYLEGSVAEAAWWPFSDPFHPKFREEIKNQILAHKAEMESPYCIGFFVDNEINWGMRNSLGIWTLKSPKEQPAKQVFVACLQEKYGTIEKLNAAWGGNYNSWENLLETKTAPPLGASEDCAEFSSATVREYFSVIRDEFRKNAPGTLYLGCRYAGGADAHFLKIAAEYCDAFSFNLYRFTLDDFRLPEGIDMPILVGEFHFGALDRGMMHWTLIGVENQTARGQAYFDYTASALRHPNFVGVHWHQYAEQATSGRFDGENFQNGFVDVCDTPYSETITKIREIGYQMYPYRYGK
ncbi:MAG: beta-galactosidase [Planctomycetia bacterium]|nr:beta-galactosidase [Planctomycetia bacterium]